MKLFIHANDCMAKGYRFQRTLNGKALPRRANMKGRDEVDHHRGAHKPRFTKITRAGTHNLILKACLHGPLVSTAISSRSAATFSESLAHNPLEPFLYPQVSDTDHTGC